MTESNQIGEMHGSAPVFRGLVFIAISYAAAWAAAPAVQQMPQTQRAAAAYAVGLGMVLGIMEIWFSPMVQRAKVEVMNSVSERIS